MMTKGLSPAPVTDASQQRSPCPTSLHMLHIARCCLGFGNEDAAPTLTQGLSTLKSRATAMPSAADTEVDEWPAPNGSYSLSSRFVNPARPPARHPPAQAPPQQAQYFNRIPKNMQAASQHSGTHSPHSLAGSKAGIDGSQPVMRHNLSLPTRLSRRHCR